MNAKATAWIGLLALTAFLGGGCAGGGGEQAGPAPGSQEWYWAAALENLESGDFGKTIEHLTSAAEMDGPLQEKAVMYRTALLVGLSRGALALADAYREGMDAVGARRDAWQNPMAQVLRDGRRYSIELAESLGAVDKAMRADPLKFDFPFPRGGTLESLVLASIRTGEDLPAAQLNTGADQTMRREMVMACAELTGNAEDPDAAKAAFESGAASAPNAAGRLAMAKMLLDISVLYDRLRVNDPDIRKILLERSENWIAPYLESEDGDAKAVAERLQEEIEDERLDMDGKRRKLGVRG